MDNLKLKYCLESQAYLQDIKFLLLDPTKHYGSNLVFLATSTKLYTFNARTFNYQEIIEVPGIVGIEFGIIGTKIYLATADGAVLSVDPITGQAFEKIRLSGGIASMKWSPDQELVAFITRNHDLVVMEASYDLIERCNLTANDGIAQNIEITWDAEQPVCAPTQVCVSFGQQARIFKLFYKHGRVYMRFKQKISGLRAPFFWSKLNGWSAMANQINDKSVILLKQYNLRRAISLPFSFNNEPIVSLKWNKDDTILMVWTKANKLYFYSINYKNYSLKQVLTFRDTNNPIIACNWDDCTRNVEHIMHIILQNGQYFIYEWRYAFDEFKCNGIVGVINGKKLLLKNLLGPTDGVLKIDSYINAVSFILNTRNESQLCLYDSDECMNIFVAPQWLPLYFIKIYTLKAHAAILRTPLQLGNMFWINESYIVASTSIGNHTNLLLLTRNSDFTMYEVKSSLIIIGLVTALCSDGAVDIGFVVHTCYGLIQEILIKPDNTMKMSVNRTLQLSYPVDQMKCLSLYSMVLVLIDTNQNLFVCAHLIDENVTSFYIDKNMNYLIYTNASTVNISSLRDLEFVEEEPLESAGSKLIAIPENSEMIVLQTPKGFERRIHMLEN